MTKIQTGSTEIDAKIEVLYEYIENKDNKKVKALLEKLYRDALSDPYLANWVTAPANITHLHNALAEYLDIPHKIMKLARRVPHKQRRAVLFIKAMLNAVEKVHGE